jgi:uncharacterized protein (DUF169 family)
MPAGSLSAALITSGQRGFNRAADAELKVAFPLSMLRELVSRGLAGGQGGA